MYQIWPKATPNRGTTTSFLTAVYQAKPDRASCPTDIPPPPVPDTLPVTNCVKTLNETQSSDPNQGKSPTGLILPTSTTGLPREGALLPSCLLSDASIQVGWINVFLMKMSNLKYKRTALWNIFFDWLVIKRRKLPPTQPDIFSFDVLVSARETFIRRSLFSSSSGLCHDRDVMWQEIGRMCGSACSCQPLQF